MYGSRVDPGVSFLLLYRRTKSLSVNKVAMMPNGDVVMIGGNEDGQAAIKLDANGSLEWRFEVTQFAKVFVSRAQINDSDSLTRVLSLFSKD